MAFEIMDQVSGSEILFKYRDFGASGLSVIYLGEYALPAVEFIGLALHHFRQDLSKSNPCFVWRSNLDKVIFKSTEEGEVFLDFSNVDQDVLKLNSQNWTGPSCFSESEALRSKTDDFTYGKYKFKSKDLIATLEYLFSNYYYNSSHDPRLAFFENLVASWNSAERILGAKSDSK